jgi:hypothetical protein
MNQETEKIFRNRDNWAGGFYGLYFQVCSSEDHEPIKLYTKYIWELNCVYGTLNDEYIKIPIKNNPNEFNKGVLKIKGYEIPFVTGNVCEENGYNWFDISIATAMIEIIFGAEYITWNANPNVPNELKIFFDNIAKELYKVYPFQLGMTGFQISGINYIEDILKNKLKYDCADSYYIGNNYYDKLSPEMKKIVKLV